MKKLMMLIAFAPAFVMAGEVEEEISFITYQCCFNNCKYD
jgi:hypothetical protein